MRKCINSFMSYVHTIRRRYENVPSLYFLQALQHISKNPVVEEFQQPMVHTRLECLECWHNSKPNLRECTRFVAV